MAKDILTGANGDLLIEDGNLFFGNGDKQNLEALLSSSIGDYKFSPLTGCNLIRLTNARINPQEVERDIRIQLKADGWKNEKIEFDGVNLTVDAIR